MRVWGFFAKLCREKLKKNRAEFWSKKKIIRNKQKSGGSARLLYAFFYPRGGVCGIGCNALHLELCGFADFRATLCKKNRGIFLFFPDFPGLKAKSRWFKGDIDCSRIRMNATLDVYDQHFAFIHYKSPGDSHLGILPKTLNNPQSISLIFISSLIQFLHDKR